MIPSDDPRRSRTLACLLALLIVPLAAAGQIKRDDPIPPGATGKVLPIQGKVTDIKGLSLGVSGKTEALAAALTDLGAKSTKTEIRIELSSDILFDFDKADLKPEALPQLEKVATVMRSYQTASSTIEGHTDNKGSRAYNQRLSERRADSVKSWLTAHSVTSPMSTHGWAETKPIAPNTHPDGQDNPEGRQKNRRVEIVIKK